MSGSSTPAPPLDAAIDGTDELFVFPASTAQRRLWFLDRLNPGLPVYDIPWAVRLDGPLDTARLAAALESLVERHEALRTTFRTVGGELVQVIAPAARLPLPVVDLAALPEAPRQRQLDSQVAAHARHRFDLAVGPLVSVRLVRLETRSHVLLANLHHTVGDGWSVQILVEEMTALYRRAPLTPPLPPVAVQYADFADAQARWLTGERLERELSHWRRTLEGADPLLLPLDRPRRADTGAPGGRRERAVPVRVARDVERMATGGASFFMVLLAALQVFLARSTGRDDVTVGTVTSGRHDPSVERTVGCFVDALALRTDLSGRLTFAQAVERVRGVFLEAVEHQAVPFDLLVEELKPERELGRTPFFDLVLRVEEGRGRQVLELGDLAVSSLATDTGTAKFDWSLTVVRPQTDAADDGDLVLVWTYRADRFDATTVERAAGQLVRLLTAAVAAPETPIDRLPLLGAGETHQVLREWAVGAPRDTGTARPQTLDGLVLERFLADPDATVLLMPGPDGSERRLTADEMVGRVGAVAAHLDAAGLAPEEIVAVAVERSPDLPAALLGVVRAGGAFLALDLDDPPARRALVLEDAGVRRVLVDSPDAEVVASLPAGVEAVPLDRIAERAPLGEPRATSGDRLAYVLYTSGSTGVPKGTLMSHGAVVGTLGWFLRQPPRRSEERRLAKTPVSFDVSVLEQFLALAAGVPLVMARSGEGTDPYRLAGRIERSGVTSVYFVPTLLAAYVDEVEAGGVGVGSLRHVICGGEVLSPELARRTAKLLGPDGELELHYGLTETAITNLSHRWGARPSDAAAAGPLPLGRPGVGSTAAVTDPSLRPVPPGVVGEIVIGGGAGDGDSGGETAGFEPLARGYLGRPAATAERFVPDPEASAQGRPGARLCRTGDLGRWGLDGRLEFLGRRDRQLEIRGARVEPGEVEAVLEAHPAVSRVVAVGVRGRLGVLVIPAGPAVAVERQALLRFAAERLPAPMVPSLVLVTAGTAVTAVTAGRDADEELPRTASGKVDRPAVIARLAAELDRAGGAGSADRSAGRAPSGALETAVLSVWRELLGRDDLGVEDDFFAVGGHSLLATRLVSSLRRLSGRDLSLAEVFENPTVAAQARRLGSAPGVGEEWEIPRLDRPEGVPGRGAFEAPVSFAQRRLWFLDRLAPGNPFYDMFGAVRLVGPLEPCRLAAAFAALTVRHESLRTTFSEGAGDAGPVQLVAPAAGSAPPLPVVDLSALARSRADRELARLAHREGRRPFDLARGPLVRLALLRLAPGDHTLFTNIHHIVSDGWSQGVLVAEVESLYRGRTLPPLAIQYADFAAWQRRLLEGEPLARLLGRWRRRLEGLPEALTLPFDRPRPAVDRFRGGARRFALGEATTDRLATLARGTGATLSMALLAAFQAVLGRAAGADDLAVGVAVANRTRSEIEPLIGFFVNTLVIRTRLDGAGLGELVRRVRDESVGAFADQDLPFELLVEELAPERSLGRNPLIQVMYGFQSFPRAEPEPGELRLEAPTARLEDSGSSKFDLTLFVSEDDGRLAGVFQYNRDLFDGVTVERLGRRLGALVAAGLERPERPVIELDLLTAAERHQLVVELGSAPGPDDPRIERGLAALVAEGARRHPERPAVEEADDADVVLSYGELASRAARLAALLGEAGVEPGDRVALAVPRSADLVVAMVGIVAAGAAYVPLDPDYPAERTRFMVDDSGARVLVAGEGLEGLAPELRRLSVPENGSASGELSTSPAGYLGGDGAAYVIYTSGSTGTPKGVEVSHRAVARLAFDRHLVAPGDRVAQAASASFDAITYEVWGALAAGGTVVVVSRRQALDPAVLEGVLAGHRVDRLFLTTALFNQVVRERPRAFAPLAGLLFGGEAVDPAAVAAVLAEAADGGEPTSLHHVYGPTETTTFASRQTVERVAPDAWTVPIGGPVASTSLHVVDRSLRPVPLGVVGELAIGGAGLAHGYLGRPAATAERFVPDPHAGTPLTSGTGEPGDRLYRTGDLVRRRQDGAIQFVGRIDHQVKLRGHRIELGEVESALLAHPAVAAAVALVREDVPGDRRLVAYVAQDPDWSPEETHRTAGTTDTSGTVDTVEDWSLIFDDLYQRDSRTGADEPGFDIAGWDSTYTGEALPAEHMRVWLADTLGAIRRVTPPGSRVLELGSGTGLLLLALAPEAALYVGTDISAEAVATVAAQTADLSQVKLFERAADQLEGLDDLALANGGTGFDTVVLNSVVQYFPTPEYLVRVLEGAARLLAPGGSIFVGDVRSLPLLPAFQADVALEQAAPDASLGAVRLGLETRRLEEGELAVAPAFFAAVARRAGLGRVRVFPKAGAHHDELTGFRYQVVLRDAPSAAAPAVAVETVDGRGTAWTAPALAAYLDDRGDRGDRQPDAVVFRGLPNARTTRAVAVLRGLDSLDAAGRGPGGAATAAALGRWLDGRNAEAETVDPHELVEIARAGGWDLALGWAEPGPEGRFDAAFVRTAGVDPRDLLPSVEVPPDEPPERHANRPLASRFARRVAPLLAAHLAERLPAYMVPGDFVALAELPLTPNGKVDRRRLPAPDRRAAGAAGTSGADADSAPRGPVEEVVAAVLADLLGLERIGAEADFFDLGGHSLLATQAISRLRRELGVELPLAVLFENPTPRALAAAVVARAGQSTAEAAAPPLVPVPDRGQDAPLTYAQERLWFLAALDPAASRYNESSPLSVAGELSLAALAAAIHRVVERHEALRTVFPQAGDPPRPVQRVLPAARARLGLPVVDLSGLVDGEGDAEPEAEARRLGGLLRELPFDLHRGPLARLVALRLGFRDHALFLGFHHIVFDGWSRSVFAREVSALYRQLTTGESAGLPALPVQMADFALWQRGWLTGDVMEAQVDHWRRELAALPALELPTDRPRGRYRMPRGAAVPLVVDGELADRLARLGRRRGATLFMVLAAAVQALLARWSGQDDFALGTPVAQRTREEIEPLVGFFVNMLVLRADVAGDPTFDELIGRVRDRSLAAYSHQDVPFEKLVEELAPARDPGRNPLFQASFQLYNAPAADLDLGEARVGGSGGAGRGAKWDLEVSLTDTDRVAAAAAAAAAEEDDDEGPRPDLAGQILYDAGLFERRTVEALAEDLRELLAAVAERPGERLSTLSAPGPDELAQLLVEGSGQGSDFAADTGLHELVAARAEAYPGAVAVAVAGDTEAGDGLTYGDLMTAARALAGRLRALGVEPGDRVGLSVERSAGMVAAMVGILRAGAAYVPLDPAYPAERLAWMAGDAGLAALVHDGSGRPVAEAVEVPTLDLDDGSASQAAEPVAAPRAPGGDALAYVVYTSGSTGTPKGVAVSHRAVARLVTGADYVALGPDDRVGQMANASFDAATWEVWGPLAAGGRVVILPGRVALEPERLGAALRDEGVTALFVTTALFDRLVAEAPGIFSSLDHLLFGGEAVDPATVARLLGDGDGDGDGPPRRLVHVYGPTEATTFATWHRVEPRDGTAPEGATTVPRVPIGRPIANTRALVLDRRGSLVPVPERGVGELLLGGPGLARGYLGRPAATAAAFVPDPFAATPGERLYRTGDLVRRDGAGRIEFVGRLDAQVKVRGFRVEPGEIEARLAEHPAVERAAVLVSGGRQDGDARLVAYLVPTEPGTAAEELAAAARKHCARTLPPHLMPAAFGVVDALPLTPNGKLDRAALGRLPTVDTAAEAGDGTAGEPQSPTEEILSQLFAEVVGTVPDRGGDFFDLGGHSLSAIQLVSRVRGGFGVEVPLVELFDNPTVAAFARRIDAALAGDVGTGEAPPLSVEAVGDDGRPGPLSFAQERLWIIDRMEPGSSLYNMPLAVGLDGDLDAAALARAAAELIRRHGALRTSFEWLDGRPVQRIEPFEGLDVRGAPGLPLIDLSGLPEAGRTSAESEAERLRRAEAAAPFDLELGPVARLRLVRLGPRRHLLTATLHHIVSDGWSLGVVERELAALYTHYHGGGAGPSPLPALPVQYPDYARWQRDWLSGEVLERHLDHWRRALADVRDLQLPTDRPASGLPHPEGGLVAVALEPGVAAGLEALARRSGATPFMALLALWQTMLARSSGQWGLAVGTPVANRTRQEIEGLIGFFVNTLVLASAVGPEDDFARALERVRAVTLDAFAHQEMPFQKLVAELVGDRKIDRTPLFQTLFALQNAPRQAAEMPGLELAGAGGGVPQAHFDLSLELEATAGGGFAGSLTYRRSLFDRTTALGLARRFETLARGVLATPELPLARLPLLSAAERHQIVVEANDTRLAVTSDLPVHERFLEQAARRPGAVALRFGTGGDGGTVTYGELAERSGALARRMVALGVGPEDRVALALGRELAMVVALIAVLRAGAAYVPLDLEAPRERLERIVAEASPRLLVARGDGDLDSWTVLAPATCQVLGVDENGLPQGSTGVPGTSGAGISSATAGAVRDRLPGPPSLQALAVVYYTSGSTGVPKGVGTTHLGLARLLDSHARFQYGPHDVVAFAARFSFDVSNIDLWSALAHGGQLVLVALDDVMDPDAFARRMRTTGVTVLAASAALFSRVMRETPELMGEMRLVSTGGEAADPVAVERMVQGPPSHHPAEFLNVYGPTESTTDAVDCHLVGGPSAMTPRTPSSFVPAVLAPAPGSARPVPIGRPIPETVALVVNRQLEPVPSGVEGELLLGGPGLARGYLGQPAETAEAFVPDFTGLGGPGGRLYRTRDLVRRRRSPADEAGLLDFVGRVDTQVKLRGFRIELGEVELTLVDHPTVDQAVAVLWSETPEGAAETPDSPSDRKRLVAYVVPALEEGAEAALAAEVDVGALRDHCREHLPDYMVPTYVVVLSELPVTANDKVDRDALPSPRAEDLGLDRSQGPRTPLEETLVELWREVLGVTPGIHDDFFAAGGHSLSAIQVISRLRGVLGVELPIRTLFEQPTVAELARVVARLESGAEGGDAPARPPLVPVDRSGPLELSFAQERLWLLDRMGGAGSGAVYNMPMGVTLDGELDIAALGGAVLDLVRRHEPLRTRFAAPEGSARAVQRIAPADETPPPGAGRLAVVDLEDLRGSRADREIDRLASAEAARPFDLARDRPVRTVLLRRDPRGAVLLLTLHHIVSDGWSMGLVRREIAELYGARRDGRPAALAELPVQAADHAAWERLWFGGEHRQRALAWWREALAGVEPLELPTDRPRRRVPSTAGALARIPLPPAAGAALEELAERFRVTPFMVLSTVWKTVVARWTGQWDMALGTPVANRHRTEVEGLVGFFVNSVVLRSRLAPERSWADALALVREVTLGAFAHQEVPFQVLVQELAPDRGLQRSPFFQMMLAVQNTPDSDAELPGVALGSLPARSRTSRYDMTVSFDAGRHLVGSVEYSTELFDRSTIQRLGRRFARALLAVAEEPSRSLAELPLLSAGGRHQVVVGWNDTAALDPRSDTAHGLFFAQAARRPEATALLDLSAMSAMAAMAAMSSGEAQEVRTLTYGELAGRVRELANELRRAGVGLETPVGVLLPASVELVVAQLAVLAAGGAYVPLAVDDPPERLARVTRDVGARLVLTVGAFEGAVSDAASVLPDITVWALDRPDDRPPPRLDPSPTAPPGPDSLAYVMYTSGSTGEPKGVEVPHRGIVRLVSSRLAELAIRPDDRLLLAAPVTFDAATFELWGALARGASLVIPPTEPSLETLGRTVREAGVSVLWSTSGLFALMVDRRLDDLRGLRLLLTGGDVLPEAPARRFRQAVPGCLLVNCYGPTENTTFTTTQGLGDGPGLGAMEARGATPIGRAIPGTTVVVTDPWLRPVPAGTRGELVTGGPGVARGYRGRPAETARRFVPDPWSPSPGACLYRTGDLVRTLHDGRVEFVGRLDDQVKIRGFRIEPDEVRVCLERLPQVTEAVVVVGEDRRGDKSLWAYVVAAGDAFDDDPLDDDPLEARLAEELARRLPRHLLPASIMVLERLPLTRHGKLDRRALPAPHEAAGEGTLRTSAARYAPPRTDLERRIAGLWEELLEVERVGVHDSFFDLGGHSLALLEATSRLGALLGRELPGRLMFEHPTVAALAAALEAADGAGGTEDDDGGSEAVAAGRDRGAARRSALGRRRAGSRQTDDRESGETE